MFWGKAFSQLNEVLCLFSAWRRWSGWMVGIQNEGIHIAAQCEVKSREKKAHWLREVLWLWSGHVQKVNTSCLEVGVSVEILCVKPQSFANLNRHIIIKTFNESSVDTSAYRSATADTVGKQINPLEMNILLICFVSTFCNMFAVSYIVVLLLLLNNWIWMLLPALSVSEKGK